MVVRLPILQLAFASSSTSAPSRDAAAATAAGTSTSSTAAAGASKPANFNDAIAATMAKLKESDATATSSSAASDNPFAGLSGAEGEEMAKLLAALSGSGGDLSGLEGAMDNPELTKMLEGMMDESCPAISSTNHSKNYVTIPRLPLGPTVSKHFERRQGEIHQAEQIHR